MKFLIAGDWHSELHEEVVAKNLSEQGHDVHHFKWHEYFSTQTFWHICQNKFILGPKVNLLNRELIAMAVTLQPECLFLYRGTHIFPGTLKTLRRLCPNTILVGYNNDDPFSLDYPRYVWRHFLKSIPLYDLILAYRHVNIGEYITAGAKNVQLLRSWFSPDRNRPVTLNDKDQKIFETEVVFIGHYEPDQRLACIKKIIQSGLKFRLFGPGKYWDPILNKDPLLQSLIPVELVWGDDYNRALCGAKIALCFLSKLNRDTYTRRCFEIPATGTMMLSEYTDDLAGLLTPGIEADYFRSPDEMVEKIKFYLANTDQRTAVAQAGQRRVWDDGHDIGSRMRQLVSWIEKIKEDRGL
jgi:spore maturation protein CgeB